MRRAKFDILIGLMIGLAVLAAAFSQASGQGMPPNTQAAFRRFDREMELIERLARLSPTPELLAQLQRARQLRNEAMAQARAGRGRAATEKLAAAQAILDQIRARALEGPMGAYVQRFSELLRRVEERAGQIRDRETERLVERAREQARKAEQLARRGETERAAEAYRNAIFLLETADKRVQRDAEMRRRAETAEERYRALADRLRQQSGDPLQMKLVQEARRHAEEARKAAARAKWEVALSNYNSALRLLYRALETQAPDVGRNLHELDTAIDQALSQQGRGIRGSALGRRILRLREEAWRHYHQGQMLQAARKAEVARRLLDQLTLAPGQPGAGEGNLRRELENLKDLVRKIEQEEGREEDPGLFQAIEALIRTVERDLDEGRLRPASRKLVIGYRLLGFIQARGSEQEGAAGNTLGARIQQLQMRLDAARAANPDDPLWAIVEDLLDRAQRALDEGRIRAAQRSLRAAESLLDMVETGGGQ